ncbi:hypothetical protein FRB93_005170 [Tulasnella sp. JGI-2019a]|nr:hypothetical protein FRB93_005170 [Tulasnella sp. JGI-2019a]
MSKTNITTPPLSSVHTQSSYTIPDFISMSPSPLRVNPNYASTAQSSVEWLDSFGVHPNPTHRAAFRSMDFGMLTAMCYADANRERFRLLCDYINALFAYDDLADEGGLRIDGDGAQKAAEIIMECLRHPTVHNTPFKIGKVFSRRVLSHNHRTLLIAVALLQPVGTCPRDRYLTRGESSISGDHRILRRDNGALKMCFAMAEFSLGLDIPDAVFQNPLIKIMEDAANDVVVLANDIYSYNIEQAQGDTQNIIETTMKQNSCSLQEAMDFAGTLVSDRIQLFVKSKLQLPSFGSERVDHEVQLYLRICEDWMTGGFHWSLRSDRYFGDDAKEVVMTRIVRLLPKRDLRGEKIIPGLLMPMLLPPPVTQQCEILKLVPKVSQLGFLGWGFAIASSLVEWIPIFVP